MSNNITEVSFYNLTRLPIQKAAPKLIEKIYYSNQRILVIFSDHDLMKSVDDCIWSYSTKHFIPHATENDDFIDQQPVLLTTKLNNSNNSSILMTIGAIDLGNFALPKVIHMFDGNDQKQLDFARARWKHYQNLQINIIYWQQKEDGSWEKKAN